MKKSQRINKKRDNKKATNDNNKKLQEINNLVIHKIRFLK